MQKRAALVAQLRSDATGWKNGCDTARAETAKLKRDVEATRINMPSPRGAGGGNFGGLFTKTAAAAAAATVAVKGFFSADSDVEGMVRSLAAVSDGSESLRAQIAELQRIASQPGINMTQAMQGSIALQSAGLSAKEARAQIEQWANAVATANGTTEDLGGTITAVAQMLSKPTVQMEEIAQISERVKNFRGIAARIPEELKTDPKAYLEAVRVELAKMDRVSGGAREAVDNLADSWRMFLAGMSGGKIAAGISAGADAVSRILKGEQNFAQAFTQAGEEVSSGSADPFKKYELTDAQRRKKAAEFADNQAARRTADRRKVIEDLGVEHDFAIRLLEIEKLRADGQRELADTREDELELAKQLHDFKKAGVKVEDDVLQYIRAQIAARREERQMVDRARFGRQYDDARKDLAIAGARHMGRNKKADRLEDSKKYNDLVRQGMNPKMARDLVERERDQAEDEALGPGRRRLRQRRPEIARPGLNEDPRAVVAPDPAARPGRGRRRTPEENRAAGEQAGMEVVKGIYEFVKRIAQNTAGTPAEKSKPGSSK